jgi:hypothetical protein
MNPSGMEEHCVWDPARIAIIRRLRPAEYAGHVQQQRAREARLRCLHVVSVKSIFAACRQALVAFASSVRSLGVRFLRFFRQHPRTPPPAQALPPITRPRLRPNHGTDSCYVAESQQTASVFWSRISRGFEWLGQALVSAANIVGRAVLVAGIYVAVSGAAALKAAASGLRNLMVKMHWSNAPSHRANRVQPVNASPIAVAEQASRPAPVLLRESPTMISIFPQQQQQQQLGFWLRAANVVKAIATDTAAAANKLAASAGSAMKLASAFIAAGIASITGSVTRFGSSVSSQFLLRISTSSAPTPAGARSSPRASSIDPTVAIPCERFDPTAIFKKWDNAHLAIVGGAAVCSGGERVTAAEMASAQHVLPLTGCRCRASPGHTRRSNILVVFWPNNSALPELNFAFEHTTTRDSFVKRLEIAVTLHTAKMAAQTVLSTFLLMFHKRKALIKLNESTASVKTAFTSWVQGMRSSKIRAAKLDSFRLRLSVEAMSKSAMFELELSKNMGAAKCFVAQAEARAAAKQKAGEKAAAAAKERAAAKAKARADVQIQFAARLRKRLQDKFVREWARESRRKSRIKSAIRAKNTLLCKSVFETWWSKTSFQPELRLKQQHLLQEQDIHRADDDCVQTIVKHATGVWGCLMYNNWLEGA